MIPRRYFHHHRGNHDESKTHRPWIDMQNDSSRRARTPEARRASTARAHRTTAAGAMPFIAGHTHGEINHTLEGKAPARAHCEAANAATREATRVGGCPHRDKPTSARGLPNSPPYWSRNEFLLMASADICVGRTRSFSGLFPKSDLYRRRIAACASVARAMPPRSPR